MAYNTMPAKLKYVDIKLKKILINNKTIAEITVFTTNPNLVLLNIPIRLHDFSYTNQLATSCFSSKPFLTQLASHISAAILQLKFPGMKLFLIHPWH